MISFSISYSDIISSHFLAIKEWFLEAYKNLFDSHTFKTTTSESVTRALSELSIDQLLDVSQKDQIISDIFKTCFSTVPFWRDAKRSGIANALEKKREELHFNSLTSEIDRISIDRIKEHFEAVVEYLLDEYPSFNKEKIVNLLCLKLERRNLSEMDLEHFSCEVFDENRWEALVDRYSSQANHSAQVIPPEYDYEADI